jgi:hypothetical protein
VIPSPWNPIHGITLISGTSDEGLGWALDKLIFPNGLFDLFNDLSFVQDSIVVSFQTAEIVDQDLSLMIQNLEAQASPEGGETVSTTPTQVGEPTERAVSEQPTQEQGVRTPNIGTYLFYGLIALVIIIGIVAITRTILGGRKM